MFAVLAKPLLDSVGSGRLRLIRLVVIDAVNNFCDARIPNKQSQP